MHELKESTSLIFDIRNFTPTLRKFEEKESNDFLVLIENLSEASLELLDEIDITTEDYFGTTGDGFLTCFFEKKHFLKGFLFGLVFEKVANNIIKNFNTKENLNLSFGIGIESGSLREILIQSKNKTFKTYIGSAINTTARIESITKQIGRTNLIIGKELNQLLVLELFSEDYNNLIRKTLDATEVSESQRLIRQMNDLNQSLLLSYLFEHNLKGVPNSLPLFRLSPTISNQNKNAYSDLLLKICGKLDLDHTKLMKRIKK